MHELTQGEASRPALRRYAKDGQLRVLQPGTSHREAVYGRQVKEG